MSAVVDLSTPITPGPSDIHVIHITVQDTVAPDVTITSPLASAQFPTPTAPAAWRCRNQRHGLFRRDECRVPVGTGSGRTRAAGAQWRTDHAFPAGTFGAQTIMVRARDAPAM